MRKTLFRPEATEGLRPRLEGDVVALAPLSGRVIVIAASLAVSAALVFSATARYSKYVAVPGELAPKAGLVRMLAPSSGTLRSSAVEGQVLAAGEVVAIIDTPRMLADGQATAVAQRALTEERAALSTAEASARKDMLAAQERNAVTRVHRLQAAAAAATAARQSAATALQLAKDTVRRQRELAAQGFVAETSVAASMQAQSEREVALQQTEQARASLEADIAAAQATADEARLQRTLVEAGALGTRASLNAEALAAASRAEAAMTAPVTSRVVAVPALGGAVQEGALVAVLAPVGDIYAHLVLPEAAAAKARVGQRVVMRLNGQPLSESEAITGVISSISSASIASSASSAGHLALVKLDEPAKAKPGSRVDARVLTETRTLLGWLFEPLTRGFAQIEPSRAQAAEAAR